MSGASILATNAVLAAGPTSRREVTTSASSVATSSPGTDIPSSWADKGVVDTNTLSPTESRWDAALDFVESDSFNTAVTVATGAVVAGTAAVGTASGGLVAAATAGAVATAGFAATVGAGMLVGAGAAWVGNTMATLAFEKLGFEKFGKESDLPATVGHPIAHSFAALGAWGMLAGAIAAVAVGALVVASGGILLVAVLAGAAVGGLAMGISSAAGQFGTNKGTIAKGSLNVFFNGKPVARLADEIVCSDHGAPQKLAEGSKTVFANGLPIVRVGHKTTCAGAVNDGCPDISITKQTNPVHLTIKTGWDIRIARTLTAIVNFLPFPRNKKSNKPKQSSKVDSKPTTCATCKLDPIDVSNGDFMDSRTDFVIPATLPIVFNRHYRTKSKQVGQLGHKWSTSWSQHLVIEENEIHYHDEEGQKITFYNPEDEINTEHLRHPHLKLFGKKCKCVSLYNQKEQCTYEFGYHAKNRYWLTRIYDHNNNQIDFQYDQQGLLEVSHSDGLLIRVISHHFLIKEVYLRENNHFSHTLATYQYNENHYLTKAHSTQQGIFNYKYDRKGRIVSWADTKDTEVYYQYDEQDRVISTRSKSGHHQGQLHFNDKDHSTTILYPNEKEETYYYDKDGLVYRFIDGNNNEWLTQWNQQFQIISTTDPLGNQHHYQYDVQSNLIQSTDPEGRSTHFAYNTDGALSSQTDASGNSWVYSYDDKSNLKSITNPLGETQKYRHDEAGKVLRIDLPNGYQHRIDYDQFNRPHVIQNTQGYQHRLHHDALGRITSETDGDGNTTRYEYDGTKDNPRNNVSRIVQHDDSHTQYQYDQEGQIKNHTDAEGNTSHYEHGAFDLLHRVTDPQGHTLHYEYDDETRFKAIINQQGERHEYTYDPAGNLIKETDYSGLQTHYDYDAAGRQTHRYNPDRSVTEYQYDNSGLLLNKRTRKQGEKDLISSYKYDERGQLTHIDNGTVKLSYAYDALGRVTEETIDGKTTHYQYEVGISQATQRSNDHNTLAYQYDSEGHLSQFTIGEHQPLQYQRNQQGQELSRHSASGFQMIQAWDRFGRLKQQVAGNEDILSSLQSHDSQSPKISAHFPDHPQLQTSRRYDWDKNHNLIKQYDQHRGTQETRYDSRQQIVERTNVSDHHNTVNKHNPIQQEHFSYTNKQQPSSQTIQPEKSHQTTQNDYQYGAAGRVKRKGNVYYLYDGAGRQIEKRTEENGFRPKVWKYRWNAEGQLSHLQTPKGEQYEYRYDGLGRRTQKINQSLANAKADIVGTHYHWDGDNLTQEAPLYADGSIAWDKAEEWIYQPNSFIPLAKRTVDDELFYVVTDHLGTPKELISEDGKHTVWAGQLSVWGKASNDSQYEINCPIRFQGQWEDEESGLYYNRHRYYDSDAAQYISPDPIGLDGGVNPQAYVSDPNGWVDPFGLARCRLSTSDTRKLEEKYSSDGMKNPHKHHIVREQAPRSWSPEDQKYITDSQKILENEGINLNRDIRNFTIAENGAGAHTKKAAKHVYDQLSKSTDITKTLSDLAENMNKGIFF